MSYVFIEGMILAFALFLLGILAGCVLSLFLIKPDKGGDWNPWEDFDRTPDPSPDKVRR